VLVNARLDEARIRPSSCSPTTSCSIAGNETTRNAMSGGLLALIEHPDELAKLRESRAGGARSRRSCAGRRRSSSSAAPPCDFEIRGQKVRAGQALCLFYPSANRDEYVFDAPSRSAWTAAESARRVRIGEHFCLGANLARLELRVVFRELACRLVGAELTPVGACARAFGGVKHMRIRTAAPPA
jgi:cholest-4-en-3-one 26-monooxygenase